ncbi:micronuclear linker histone polyprotein-like [Periplaneta americana]|uniref:micronuclear linker histone polyprotein-like n=1 Tax=Periplaneta americana TaxID=6978 RepID=UPI0037E763A2
MLYLEEVEREKARKMKGKEGVCPDSRSLDHLCNRYCGGSHTTTTPHQRVTRMGHFLTQWGPEAIQLTEGTIRGTDGQMYRTRTLPEEVKDKIPSKTLSSSDVELLQKELSQTSGSLSKRRSSTLRKKSASPAPESPAKKMASLTTTEPLEAQGSLKDIQLASGEEKPLSRRQSSTLGKKSPQSPQSPTSESPAKKIASLTTKESVEKQGSLEDIHQGPDEKKASSLKSSSGITKRKNISNVKLVASETEEHRIRSSASIKGIGSAQRIKSGSLLSSGSARRIKSASKVRSGSVLKERSLSKVRSSSARAGSPEQEEPSEQEPPSEVINEEVLSDQSPEEFPSEAQESTEYPEDIPEEEEHSEEPPATVPDEEQPTEE